MLAFLHFVIEETLSNGGAGLKEVVIGNAIYQRDPPYDSRIDSTVRVEARRLRSKLKHYYTGSGSSANLVIDLPTGGYIPTFTWRSEAGPIEAPAEPETKSIFREGNGAAIAIMPFRAISRDPGLETFADGLTDELIYTMGQSDGLWIASRSTVFQYKGEDRSPAELAKLLNVDAVMQGAVREDKGILRVTVELSDTEGFVVWSDRFDVPDQDRIQLQEKIAKTLLSRARLDTSKMRDMEIGPGPAALRANAKVYRARLLLDQQTPDSIRNAQRLFAQVAEAAPDYARGHSGIADCLCDLFRLGVIRREEAHGPALAAAEAALAIDPRSVEAHAARAAICAWMERSPPEAKAAFDQARRLGTSARANRLYGVFLSLFGDHDLAMRLFREAREIEPFSTQQDIAEAISHYHARRYAMLTEPRDRAAIRLLPGEALVYVALAHIFSGDTEAAGRLVDSIVQQCRELPDQIFIGQELAAWLGDQAPARALTRSDLTGATAFASATLAASIKDEAACLDALEQALDRGELSTAWMRSDQRFDAIRDSARFKRLLERLRPL